MDEYKKKWFGRGKLYKECLNYLDSYKACIVGINQDKLMLGGIQRKSLTEDELYKKRAESKQRVRNGLNEKTDSSSKDNKLKESVTVRL
jgi:uncharacterized iron-regulated protein